MFLQKRRFTASTEVITAGKRLTVCVCSGWATALPVLTAILGGLPTPIEHGNGNIFPNHTPQGFLIIFTNGFAFEGHLALFELSHKIEISPFIVPPSLFPLAALVSKLQTLIRRNRIEA